MKAGTRTLRETVDTRLSRVSMHGVTLIALAALAALAIVLGACGALPFSPAAMAATLAVTVVASAGVTLVGSAIVRRRPMPESAAITGLLLFFLVWPSTDPATLAWYAAAAGAAAAAKYLLVFRGAHLVNPAAFGAAALAVSGKGAVSWWIGSTAMFAAVVVAGVLVTRRTGTMRFAWGVAAGAYVVTAATLLVNGSGVASALSTAALSNPWVFWAVFMVTEPMTAPQRARDRWLVGALMVLLIAVPVHFAVGSAHVATSPELVLLVANVVTALVQRPRPQWARVTAVERVGADGLSVVFEVPRALGIRAGQWVEVQAPRGGFDRRGARRVFTPIGTGRQFSIVTRVPADASSFKREWARLRVGERVRVTRKGGSFLLPRDPDLPLLLVAGGVGVTPVLAFLDELGPGLGGRT